MFRIEIREYGPAGQDNTRPLLRIVLLQELETLDLEKVLRAINGMPEKPRSHRRKAT